MTNPSPIETVVMRRVRAIRVLRFVFSTSTASCFLLLLSLWGIGELVWVERVFSNAPTHATGQLAYLWYAFGHTQAIVQVLTLVTATAAVSLARSTAQTLSEMRFLAVRA